MKKLGKPLMSGRVEIQYDDLGRPFINLPVPPGYKAVSKDGMPIDGWPYKETWVGDELILEIPDEITIVKDVN